LTTNCSNSVSIIFQSNLFSTICLDFSNKILHALLVSSILYTGITTFLIHSCDNSTSFQAETKFMYLWLQYSTTNLNQFCWNQTDIWKNNLISQWHVELNSNLVVRLTVQ
jgi:hypothetical protein